MECHITSVLATLNLGAPDQCVRLNSSHTKPFQMHIVQFFFLSYLCANKMSNMVLETYVIENLFFWVRQRQCQYSIENATKNVPATTHQPTSISRLQSSRVQSHVSRSGRPSGIPVKTAANNSLRQGKVNQPTQHEGVGEGTSKSLNNMVVSDAMSLKIVPCIVLNIT
jgi:hypothetical protein